MNSTVAKQIEVTGYTHDGKPTCCLNVETREICQFLGTKTFGTKYVCMCGEQTEVQEYTLNGYLKPHNKCPIWNPSK